MKHSKFPYLVLIPILVLMTVFIIVPIIGSFGISFMDYNPLRTSGNNSFIGLTNFKKLFTDTLFQKALVNTFLYVGIFLAVNMAFTLTVGQILAVLRSGKWRSVFRVAFFLPCVAPLTAVAVVWGRSILQSKGGLLNMMLGTKINWLDADHLMLSMIVLSLWADVGYNIILFTSGIEGIPRSYYEAAEIDGCGPIRRFFQITFPLLNRTFVYVLITTVVSQFQAFAQFAVMAKKGGAGYSAYLLAPFIYDTGFELKNMGYACAVSMVLFLILLICTLIERRVTRADWGY